MFFPPATTVRSWRWLLRANPLLFPTGYHAAELAMVAPGKSVAVFGAGPVGLMAAHSAFLKGASQVFVVDKEPDRLALAEQIGATAINFADTDPAEAILEGTDGFGADCGIEAVGYQAHDHTGEEHPEMVLDNLVKVVRATGHIGVLGVYVPEDPGASNDLAKEGRVAFADTDPAEAILEGTDGFGADCGIEAVGYQAHDHTGEEHPEMVLDNLVKVVRATGHIGVVGVYVPEDPGASNDLAKEGRVAFNYGAAFAKGISIAGGQCPVKSRSGPRRSTSLTPTRLKRFWREPMVSVPTVALKQSATRHMTIPGKSTPKWCWITW
ncbi:zinc-binding dehydrogenase [Arthrobacter sp. Br18]|uniref:zinc-binding dehydrogenase n=1 Tax=Arthrobacter sp. Br18 TaxID=1312954 RepID=UPI0020A68B31|nr:zinc-binding dehydrogenase [Arthrobacter sp. Br18]